jgi:outer membrane protein OmpA-like peptidoglycan-associated protein
MVAAQNAAKAKANAPLPDWKAASAGAIEIPRIEGLLVDSTISTPDGDLEDLDQILAVSASTVTKRVDNEVPPKPGAAKDPNAPHLSTGAGTMEVDTSALDASNHFNGFFAHGKTVHYPGTTDRGVSTETLQKLRSGASVTWWVVTNVEQMMAGAMSMQQQPDTVDWNGFRVYACDLQRVEAQDVGVPVLVNGEPAELPAIHTKCSYGHGENHFYILDQPSNPIFLYTRLGPVADTSQTTKIVFPAKKPSDLETKLAEREPVEIYGIYFDFNSAFIKPESEVVLKQIADVMTKNPTWKLSVSGHTDNIGGDDFNLKLSQARSASVKAALVTEYKIDPDRLITSGYGASQPIADNSKVEGRARNRRVVLERQ